MERNLHLLWEELFTPTSDGQPDGKIWNFDLGDGSAHGIPGWGNQEREFYVRSNARTNFGLSITATRTDQSTAPDAYYGKAEWLSSKIHTAGKVAFRYGRFEFEAKSAAGGGSWPAIWMLGTNISSVTWPHCGEIDIFEGAGNRPREIRGTLHGPAYSGDHGITGSVQIKADLSEDFHTYAIEWLPDSIVWFVDGDEYFSVFRKNVEMDGNFWPFDQEFYLIINLAIGGWFAGEVAEGFDSSVFQVKSIRHYSIDGIGAMIQTSGDQTN